MAIHELLGCLGKEVVEGPEVLKDRRWVEISLGADGLVADFVEGELAQQVDRGFDEALLSLGLGYSLSTLQ